MIQRIIPISVLILFMSCQAFGQQTPVLSSDSFMGIVLEETTFHKAVSILKPLSYKKPYGTWRSMKLRGGGCIVEKEMTYKIEKDNIKARVTLSGSDKVENIYIRFYKAKDIHVYDILPGITKAEQLSGSLHVLNENKAEFFKYDTPKWLSPGVVFQYKDLIINIRGKEKKFHGKYWKKKRIKELVLSRTFINEEHLTSN